MKYRRTLLTLRTYARTHIPTDPLCTPLEKPILDVGPPAPIPVLSHYTKSTKMSVDLPTGRRIEHSKRVSAFNNGSKLDTFARRLPHLIKEERALKRSPMDTWDPKLKECH